MKFKARIEVRLRRDSPDPESETIKKSLVDLNFQVLQVKVAKVYEITFDAATRKDAEALARTMCARLLVNPTKDEYEFRVEPTVGGSAAKP
ncbi:MAG: phosphoribosylformylglycinamidine synthase subunit PurS [Nitrososphaerales archaeon]